MMPALRATKEERNQRGPDPASLALRLGGDTNKQTRYRQDIGPNSLKSPESPHSGH